MKKIIALLLASTLMFSTLTACSRKREPDDNASTPAQSGIYKDGTYSVNYADPAQDRTLDYLTVTVTDDEVVIQHRHGLSAGHFGRRCRRYGGRTKSRRPFAGHS